MKLPQVMGLVFCERFTINATTHEASLDGLFQALRYRTFPGTPQPFVVYVSLYGSSVEGTIEMRCTRLETETDVFSYRVWRSLPDGYVVQLPIPVRMLRFPAARRY